MFDTTKTQAWALTVLRVIVGLVFAVHGWDKVSDLAGTAGFFGNLGIPAPQLMAYVVAFLELVGGIALILGLFTRWLSIPLAITILVALITVHLENGFSSRNGGYEYTLTLLGATIALALGGSGAFALEKFIPGLRGRTGVGSRRTA